MAVPVNFDPSALTLDSRGLESLRQRADKDPKSAVKAAAQQFEGLFLQMMLKTMREASPSQGDGLFDSEQTKMYTSMLDQQLAQVLAKRGTGLADVIAKQLSGPASAAVSPEGGSGKPGALTAPLVNGIQHVSELDGGDDDAGDLTALMGMSDDAAPDASGDVASASAAPADAGMSQRARDFVNRMWPYAAQASQATGIPAHFILAQAALESGWGKSQAMNADGTPSYNLFNIKAGKSWGGDVATAATTEYVNGAAQKTSDGFRSYGSYRQAFMDYAQMLKSQPRYAGVIANGQNAAGFANGLQQAGYATDPSYADKLVRVINGSLLRQGLTG